MRTHQDVFTPMRGHIEDGCVIDCENGDVLTLKADMSGWSLADQAGKQLGRGLNAWQVTHLVATHGKHA